MSTWNPFEDNRRHVNAEELAAAPAVAAAAARETALACIARARFPLVEHYATVANAVTDAVLKSVDAKHVKPAHLADIANAGHRAAKAAVKAGAQPEEIAVAVLEAAAATTATERP